jgi:pimeloyl-ACP methyl ester carboxylesterase
VADCTIGSSAHPLVVFSHGMAGHQHQYFSLVSDLVASGAIVLAVEHTDGSAAFSRKPPANCTAHGQGAPVPLKALPCKPGQPGESLFRFDQLYKTRVPEALAALDFLRTGGAHATLLAGSADNDLTLRHMMACTADPSRPLKVGLVGHSFGGATVAAAAMSLAEHERALEQVSGVVAFDMWHVPSQGFPIIARPIRARLPRALFMDSEEWTRDDQARRRVVEVAAAWGPRGSRVWTQGTDHLTPTEAAYQFKVPLVRKPYKYQDDRRQTTLWAHQALGVLRDGIANGVGNRE